MLRGVSPALYLLLLLPGQLHLLPLLLQLWRSHLLLLVVGCQELLPQVDQLADHGGQLTLLLLQWLWRTWTDQEGTVFQWWSDYSSVLWSTTTVGTILLTSWWRVKKMKVCLFCSYRYFTAAPFLPESLCIFFSIWIERLHTCWTKNRPSHK